MYFRFDWSGKEPLLYNEKVSIRTKSIASGTAHAIFMWWDLNMDTDNQVMDFFNILLLLFFYFYNFYIYIIFIGVVELCSCMGTSKCT